MALAPIVVVGVFADAQDDVETDAASAACADGVQADALNAGALIAAARACQADGDGATAAAFAEMAAIRVDTDREALRPIAIVDVEAADATGRDASWLLEELQMQELRTPSWTRDAAAGAGALARLEAWRPDLPTGYDPGWRHTAATDATRYAEIAAQRRAEATTALSRRLAVAQDPEYAAAFDRLSAIEDATDPTAQAEMAALAERLRAIAERVAADVPEAPRPDRLEPVADPAARVLHVGFDGPGGIQSNLFETAAAARTSWLADTLPPETLETVLAQIDFADEALLAEAFGRVTDATGRLVLARAQYGPDDRSFHLEVHIGVRSVDCGSAEPVAAHPLVLAATARPTGAIERWSGSTRLFADGCDAIAPLKP